MNGAEALIGTLVDSGVNVCFANPGTSETHLVAAFDQVPEMRAVLCLYEGVATGAADGYGRMAEAPASTLLHLGPGLVNGLSNLHNARKAGTPVINIVGDHSVAHRAYEAPLTSDIEAPARPYSHWLKTSDTAGSLPHDAATAVAAARSAPGQIATLIVPADTAWNEGAKRASPVAPQRRSGVGADALARAVTALRSGERVVLLLGGPTLRAKPLEVAGRIAAKTGAKIMAPTQNARAEVGAGRVAFARVPYPVDQALAALAEFQHVILVCALPPVSFFAYRDKPGVLTAPGANFCILAEPQEDGIEALQRLAEAVGAENSVPILSPSDIPAPALGKITPEALSQSVVAYLPEGAIVIDEGATVGRGFFSRLVNGRPGDYLNVSGGSIGWGMPCGVGAAIACPSRKVLCIEGDGSAMYSPQALWTMARENLDVTVVVFVNRSYATLVGEMANAGVRNAGRKAMDLFDLSTPPIDFIGLAKSLGVAAVRVANMEEFNVAFARQMRDTGPGLVEVLM